MYLEHLWLRDFRNYHEAELEPAPGGLTVISGPNGSGKTSLLESVAYLQVLRSMRGAPTEAMVRAGAEPPVGVVRSVWVRGQRRLAVDAVVGQVSGPKARVDGKAVRRTRELSGLLAATVFSPDDLTLVKGGPDGRRSFLDGLLTTVSSRRADLISELERILRQRNALLRHAGPGGYERAAANLDVWDSMLARVGEDLAAAREELVRGLQPIVQAAYSDVAGGDTGTRVELEYRRSWQGPLDAAVAAARDDDLRRAVTTVGPHRDDLDVNLGDLAARTHASQGEQRTLALALRLAGHRLAGEAVGSPPVLLLDDVFSELDQSRCEALLASLPQGQAILTTAGAPPAGADVVASYRVEDGKVLA